MPLDKLLNGMDENDALLFQGFANIAPLHTTQRILHAERVMDACIGRNGICASPGLLEYWGQNWVRDASITQGAYLLRGKTEIVRTHLQNVRDRQKPDGSISDWFADSENKLLMQKAVRGILQPSRLINWKNHLPLLVRKFPPLGKIYPNAINATDKSHEWTPHTTDSELYYILAMHEYAERTGDKSLIDDNDSLERALIYAEKQNVHDGLYYGCDWRDNIHFLKGKATSSNNALWTAAREIVYGNDLLLRQRLNETFLVDGKYHADFLGTTSFDTYGQALMVLHGIAQPSQYKSITDKFRNMLTPYGLRANELTMPEDSSKEERDANKIVNQYGNIWGHAESAGIRALLHMEEWTLASQVFEIVTEQKRIKEWRDPNRGIGGGATDQNWNAAGYLQCAAAFGWYKRSAPVD